MAFDVEAYPERYFADRHGVTVRAARAVLEVLEPLIPPVRSAVDVGCGVGTWLRILQELGAEDVLGIDGHWVPQEHLVVPQSCFKTQDLTEPVSLDRRFDLAISLEVAEHLPELAATVFIRSLCGLSDFVLFSAAIPYQGGAHHVNEQWPEYWAAKFDDEGFVFSDCLREPLWTDETIPFWYRQNALLFVRKGREGEVNAPFSHFGPPRGLVHPEFYLRRLESPGILETGRLLSVALTDRLKLALKTRKSNV